MIDYDGFRFPKGSRAVAKIERDRVADRKEAQCREKVDRRDGHCCFFPGCKVPSSDKHHVRPRSLGGEWDTNNILSACRKHHDWFKAGLIRVVGNPDKGPIRVLLTALGKQAKLRVPDRKEVV